MRTVGSRAGLLLTVALFAAPRQALACPVCFGQSDSPMAAATNMAIFFMLGLTGAVLAGFVAFIAYLVRRAKLIEKEKGPVDAGYYLPDMRF